jgi:MSHA biogenesis protein MshO
MTKAAALQKGFTLIELIMVIVITGILSTVVGPLITNKFIAVSQSTQRANWVQQAEFALFHLRTDLSSSVPNSICTTTNTNCDAGQIVEFLGVNHQQRDFAARYRDKQRSGYDNLSINNDGSFDLLGYFNDLPSFVSIGIASAVEARSSWQSAQAGNNSSHIAKITSSDNSLSEDDNDANTSPNPSITNIVLANDDHDFLTPSPYFRAYFTDGPIGYECDDGTLYRVSNYTSLDTSFLFSTRTISATKERIATSVTSCSFQVRGGAPFQPPTLEVQISIGLGTEAVTLVDIITLGNGS